MNCCLLWQVAFFAGVGLWTQMLYHVLYSEARGKKSSSKIVITHVACHLKASNLVCRSALNMSSYHVNLRPIASFLVAFLIYSLFYSLKNNFDYLKWQCILKTIGMSLDTPNAQYPHILKVPYLALKVLLRV